MGYKVSLVNRLPLGSTIRANLQVLFIKNVIGRISSSLVPDTKSQRTNPNLQVDSFSYSQQSKTDCSSQAFVMFREFIVGNNQTGLLSDPSATVIGGEDSSLLVGPHNILFGEDSILYGSGTRTSYYAAPSDTIASWRSYFASVVASEMGTSATATGGAH